MSFFQNLKILLEKHYIIHFFSVRLRRFATIVGHCIMQSFLVVSVVTCRPLCSGDGSRVKVRIKGPTDGEAVFVNSWLWGFWGCFGYFGYFGYFGE